MARTSKIRTVYFTAVRLFPSNNGGALVCRNQIRELACDPAVDLLACSTGPPEHEDANRQAIESLDAEYVFLPLRNDTGNSRPTRPVGPNPLNHAPWNGRSWTWHTTRNCLDVRSKQGERGK